MGDLRSAFDGGRRSSIPAPIEESSPDEIADRNRAGVALFCLAAADATEKAKPPNVVIFLADDAGWGDYTHSGNRQVSTPHIDAIATEGVSLDRFYVCPVCSPTRAEMLTGRYHPRGGVRGVSVGCERLNLDEKTLADAFKAAGYATGAFGKWHNGTQWPYHPMARGFDEYFGHSAGHWGEYFDAPLEDNGRMVRTKGYIVDVCTDRALGFIDRNKDRPFLCYVPFTTPHSPWAAPPADWQRFKDKKITQRATEPDKEIDDETRCVLAMIENQDRNVGRVLAKLDDLHLRDDTIVVYFSDNGPNSMRWTGGMKGKKGTTDEGGVRSVCYLRWPGRLPAGRTVEQIAGAIDLLPTLTSLAGVPRVGDKPLDGRDLVPLLTNQPPIGPIGRSSPPGRDGSAPGPRPTASTTWAGSTTWPPTRVRRPRSTTASPSLPPGSRPTSPRGAGRCSAPPPRSPKGRARPRKPARSTPGRSRSATASSPSRCSRRATANPSAVLRRSSGAPNCSYFVDWTDKDDRMVWSIDVHTTGRYEVVVDYTCPIADAGSLVELTFQDSRLSGRVTPGWDPPLNTNQDTLPRPHGESQMKEFRPLKLGVIELKRGQGPLTLRATEIPGKSVMDVRRVTLTLLP